MHLSMRIFDHLSMVVARRRLLREVPVLCSPSSQIAGVGVDLVQVFHDLWTEEEISFQDADPKLNDLLVSRFAVRGDGPSTTKPILRQHFP